MRINKFLALCGLGSRRKVEELVLNGEITINSKIIKDLSFDVQSKDIVKFKGEIIQPAKEYEYYMINKPKGFVTTMSDNFDRKTVLDLVKDIPTRIFPVGRLDYNTEGLLIMTNDGDLANKLMKPNFQVKKTYICMIEGEIKESELAVIRAGVVIDGKRLNKCQAKLIEYKNNKSKLEITINQGINRQIRKMMESIGKHIISLKRTKIGDLRLGGLTRGTYRKLRDFEISYLYEICNIKN